jgi:hypothetical protein
MVRTIFVFDGSNVMLQEYASLQLWIPARMEGEPANNHDSGDLYESHDFRRPSLQTSSRAATFRTSGDLHPASPTSSRQSWAMSSSPQNTTSRRLYSPTPQHAPPPPRSMTSPTVEHGSRNRTSSGFSLFRRQQPRQEHQRQRTPSVFSSSSNSSSSSATLRRGVRQDSISTQSATTNMTSVSTSTRAMSISGVANVAGVGTLHSKPTEPMLVLFTRHGETGVHGIVAVQLDHDATVNYRDCKCKYSERCPVSVLSMKRGGPLPVLRLGGVEGTAAHPARWNILPLAEAMKGQAAGSASGGRGDSAWRRVIRLSMCFDTVNGRKEFAGLPCNCRSDGPGTTQGELMECLKQCHRGKLGFVRESHRRETAAWHARRFGRQANVVVDRSWQLGFD